MYQYVTLFFLLSKSATDVKVTADMVREALEEAEKAQIAAEKAIKQADEDIQGTQNLLTSVRDCTCCVWEKTHLYIHLSEKKHIWQLPMKINCSLSTDAKSLVF